MAKQLEIWPSMVSTLSVGWERDDLPLVHVFAQAEPGQAFQPGDGQGGPHWPCVVCVMHGYTRADFERQMTALLEAATAPSEQCDATYDPAGTAMAHHGVQRCIVMKKGHSLGDGMRPDHYGPALAWTEAPAQQQKDRPK